MKRLILITFVCSMIAACSDKQQAETKTITASHRLPGDSTRYGLACDGSTDSVLVFLTNGATRIDTLDIITARQNMRIYGRPHIGDELAVMVNPEDTTEVLSVVNMEMLRGEWAYMVTPTLRQKGQQTSHMKHMEGPLPDSIRQRLLAPREYGLRMKRDYSAMAYGGMRQLTSDDRTPVEFPDVKHYTEWNILNGRLILKADTIAGLTHEGDVPETDTADIVLLSRDSLVLRFSDHEQGYYRKEQKGLSQQ